MKNEGSKVDNIFNLGGKMYNQSKKIPFSLKFFEYFPLEYFQQFRNVVALRSTFR